ncbi:hypothetical protein M0638_12320 [Roseomonas sp. NAR14]|uniref:Secreted protein n=1 Tax=Roseomonas acroporae TaxID=2937791 RepID=A0A9X1Y720_9PROT|nr:hypothetical protein [Roseomonas acroporae]MCK8785169.1 hypothetical protein [Roseomonas acroporae]
MRKGPAVLALALALPVLACCLGEAICLVAGVAARATAAPAGERAPPALRDALPVAKLTWPEAPTLVAEEPVAASPAGEAALRDSPDFLHRIDTGEASAAPAADVSFNVWRLVVTARAEAEAETTVAGPETEAVPVDCGDRQDGKAALDRPGVCAAQDDGKGERTAMSSGMPGATRPSLPAAGPVAKDRADKDAAAGR